MKPIEALGMGPTYEESWEAVEGKWVIKITPGLDLGPTQELTMTEDQHDRFLRWRAGEGKIQDMFPDFDADQRELLLSGLVW